ncbi:MAG: helix-turn-helix domain-containing protein [Candidatus Omnitrophica bacterium]|nr:helix-turn-helix domain-containing protein [Candidatus Omnitrophota bacterium]MBI2495497.1 helix-turn-helix domain-containing protein [Candidatus Omnitrophota bacterium]MBI3022059.1 helix-turn-helix domain-containing protein [Candidatus Omnitrophota bacterium]MBI3083459.1 helix-turn-helix domain-containing protein [Candidatus Omnitrophota bacterium]
MTPVTLSPARCGRMAERGELPRAKIARRWRFSEADLRAWLEQMRLFYFGRDFADTVCEIPAGTCP